MKTSPFEVAAALYGKKQKPLVTYHWLTEEQVALLEEAPGWRRMTELSPKVRPGDGKKVYPMKRIPPL